jgi:hypothetical protein
LRIIVSEQYRDHILTNETKVRAISFADRIERPMREYRGAMGR